MKQQVIVPEPLSRINLSDFDPGYTGKYNKQEARREVALMQEELPALQEMLYAQGKSSLLIVLQAMDAGGKDSTIKKVFDGINPQGIQVTSFKVPTGEELAHDFLWRIHQHTPPKGYIGIFNRSHYEDVLIGRVDKLAPPEVIEQRYDHINHFERLLIDSGTRIIKIFLHISKDEQKKRFEDRLKLADKQWKFSKTDLLVREKWDAYMQAYEEAISRCNTAYAPWHIVPANYKWYRDVVITRALYDTLKSMDLAYPEPPTGLDKVKIPD